MRAINLWSRTLINRNKIFIWVLIPIYTLSLAFNYTYNAGDYIIKILILFFIVREQCGVFYRLRRNKYIGTMPVTKKDVVIAAGISLFPVLALFILPVPFITVILSVCLSSLDEILWLRMLTELMLVCSIVFVMTGAGAFEAFAATDTYKRVNTIAIVIMILILFLLIVLSGPLNEMKYEFNTIRWVIIAVAIFLVTLALYFVALQVSARKFEKLEF